MTSQGEDNMLMRPFRQALVVSTLNYVFGVNIAFVAIATHCIQV